MTRAARIQPIVLALVAVLCGQGCAATYKQQEQQAGEMRVHCSTADGDIRVLRSEKAHVVEQLAMGVTAIYPAGMVVGLVLGTEGTKLQVATGEYNDKLDAKIAEIQRTCGIP